MYLNLWIDGFERICATLQTTELDDTERICVVEGITGVAGIGKHQMMLETKEGWETQVSVGGICPNHVIWKECYHLPDWFMEDLNSWMTFQGEKWGWE